MHSTPTPFPTPSMIVEATTATVAFDSTLIQFPGKEIKSIQLPLPSFPTKIGISIGDNDHFNFPITNNIIPGSQTYKFFPAGMRRAYFIVGINAESPITLGYAVEVLQNIQKSSDRVVTIDIVH